MTDLPAPENTIDCAACRRLLSKFVEGDLGRDERERMRGHLKACDACLPVYHETLTSAARVGRTRRETRLREEARVRRETHREMALSAGVRRRPSRFGLRLVLLPGLMALLILVVMGSFDEKPGVEVRFGRGVVEAAGVRLEEGGEPLRIGSGSWCSTGVGSAATLRRDEGTVELGPRTAVRIEHDLGPPRLRLRRGELLARGTVEVSTALGVARLEDGAGSLLLDESALRVACDEGRWVVVGPFGETEVSAGAERTFESYGALP